MAFVKTDIFVLYFQRDNCILNLLFFSITITVIFSGRRRIFQYKSIAPVRFVFILFNCKSIRRNIIGISLAIISYYVDARVQTDRLKPSNHNETIPTQWKELMETV